jgi:hypothetical protein
VSDKNDQEQEFDESALAALVRTSVAPPVANDDREDDGKLDLRALVASSPGSIESPNGAAAASAPARDAPSKGAVAKAPTSEERPPVKQEPSGGQEPARKREAQPAAAATQPAGGSAGLWVGIGIAAAACVGAYLYVSSQSAAVSTAIERSEVASAAASPRGTANRGEQAEVASAAASPRGTTNRGEQAEVAPAAASPRGEAEPMDREEAGRATAPGAAGTEPTAVAVAGTTGRETAADERGERGERDERRGGRGGRGEANARPASGPTASGSAQASAGTGTGAADETGTRGRERSVSTAAQASAGTGARPDSASRPGASSSLDGVLDQALGGRPDRTGTRTVPVGGEASGSSIRAATPTASPAAGDLPETPSQSDVRRVLGQLMPQIRACAGEQVGIAVATIIVRNDGTVASVAIGGSPFAGTPQGSCMEGALRSASFPRFRAPTFRVQYPISIR